MTAPSVLIGGASGGANDTPFAVRQLLAVDGLDYVILDFMSEPSLPALAARPRGGDLPRYVDGFLGGHLAPNLAMLERTGVKLVSNAGGLDPHGLAQAIEAIIAEQKLSLKVVAVEGDDISHLLPELEGVGITEMFSGVPMPRGAASANVYLGAFPIAAALAAGADIVVTGRVVDSAMALGPLIHEFGWRETDYDLLAAGTVIGHLIECGAQSTGGNFTDWRDVPDWHDPGYPVAECRPDGSCVLTKPQGTGGLVTRGTAAEQLLYEVGNPRAYIVPDATCDLADVVLEDVGPDRVRVTGAKGYPATGSYKACATYEHGWRAVGLTPIIGLDAVEKATRRADALFRRWRKLLRDSNLGEPLLTYHEVLGINAGYGNDDTPASREVISKLVVDHPDRSAVELFHREEAASQMNMAVGTASSLAAFVGAPKVQPLRSLFSFLIAKDRVPVRLWYASETDSRPVAHGMNTNTPASRVEPVNTLDEPFEAGGTVRLIDLAWARSGDKGNLFNVAVLARKPEYLPFIRSALTVQAVGEWYAHLFESDTCRRVDRYEAPGVHGLNFVLHEVLLGGIASGSPRVDRTAKAMAQQLLEHPIAVPAVLAEEMAGRPGDSR